MKTNIETKVAGNGTVVHAEEPKTLRELGIDGGLASEFEHAFRMMGAVRGDRVVGFTFSTPDGQRHSLRVEQSQTQPDVARAA